jgi:two-component system sensor histidine kinase KdpD
VSRRLALGAGLALGLLALELAVLVPLRGSLSSGTVALALLPPVLVATSGGLACSLAVAVIGSLVFNLVFTEPYGSFRIDKGEEVAAFVTYVAVAVVLGLVVNRVRDARDLAERRARAVTLLQELTADMIRSEELEPALRSGLRRVVEALRLRGAALRAELPERPIEASAGDVESADAALRALGDPLAASADEVTRIPISTPAATLGALAVDGALDPDQRRFVDSFAGVVALAVTRARLEREQVRRRSLEETDRLRTALVQSVSHDLRTPLTAIRTIADALRAAGDADTRAVLIDDVEHETERLTRLVESMLDLSRIESGALRPRRVLMPVDELVWGAVAAVRALPAAALEVDVPEQLPPVAVDETMMRQVLVNLLENAAAYGSPERGVAVHAARADGVLEIAVCDHGAGVAAGDRQRIFEPYRRLADGGGPSGSGLGLAISRGFVEAHGGTLTVGETPGGGARFVVSIPLDAV